jgi:signal transduction histidine kinase
VKQIGVDRQCRCQTVGRQRWVTAAASTLATGVIRAMNLAAANCVLVTQHQRLVGIFTPQDVVNAIARQVDLATVPVADLVSPLLLRPANVPIVRRRLPIEAPAIPRSGSVALVPTLDDIVNSAVVSINRFRLFADNSRVNEYRSAGCAKIFGYTAAAFQADADLWRSRTWPEDWEAVIIPTFTRVLTGQTSTVEYRFYHQDGSLRWISATFTPEWDGVAQSWIVTAVETDISKLKQADDELHSLNIELERRVQARMAELSQINLELAQEVVQRRLQSQREHALSQVIQAIRNSLDLKTVFATAAAEFAQLLHAERVCITRYLPKHRMWLNVSDYRQDSTAPSFLGAKVPDSDNSIAACLKQDRLVRIEDTRQSQDPFIRTIGQYLPGTWLIVPIQVDGIIWGSLNLVRSETLPWQEVEAELSDIVVDQLAIAIHQAELHRQLRQLNTNLERQVQSRTMQLKLAYEFEATLQQITDRVRDSLDEDQIIQGTVQSLAQGLGADCCNAALFDLDQGTSIVRYEYTASSNILAYRGRVSLMADFPELYTQLLQGWDFQFCSLMPNPKRGQVAMLTCPIQDDQGVLGDLWLVNQSYDCFSEQDIRLVRLVANQCAIALRQARLYQEAQAQVQELERLNQLKDDFLSTVSHELRTPMASIKMATQMLEVALQRGEYAVAASADEMSLPNSGGGRSLVAAPAVRPLHQVSDKVDRYLKILRDECQRETNLINDLLDLARIDAGSIPLRPIPIALASWLPQISTPFTERTRSQQQKLSLVMPPELPALATDLSCLERILTELLHNACKYTPAGGEITLSVQTCRPQPIVKPKSTKRQTSSKRKASLELGETRPVPEHSNGAVVTTNVATEPPAVYFSVSNSGIEIPASECERIFDKFYRIPNGDPWKHGGTGLGLTLVKKLTERLQGNIWIESGSGLTSFILQFPLTLAVSPIKSELTP